jgi:hypothetical protein
MIELLELVVCKKCGGGLVLKKDKAAKFVRDLMGEYRLLEVKTAQDRAMFWLKCEYIPLIEFSASPESASLGKESLPSKQQPRPRPLHDAKPKRKRPAEAVEL